MVAGVVGSMPLLLLGAVMLGATTAANSGARYAATDLATEDRRGRALSTVVWATTIGAVLGPNLSGPAGSFANAVGIPELTGPFALGTVGMGLAALVIWRAAAPGPAAARPRAQAARHRSSAVPGAVRTSSWRRAAGRGPTSGRCSAGPSSGWPGRTPRWSA